MERLISLIFVVVVLASALSSPILAQCGEEVLVPSLSQVQDRFGETLAIDGDTLAVGAPFLVLPASHGAVFVFERNFGGWRESQAILPPTGYPNQRFGDSVALRGDTLMVQEFQQDPMVAPEGGAAIHVYERQGGSWQHVQRLVEPGYNSPGLTNDFGRSMDLHDDTVYIASRREDKVHIFGRSGGMWASVDTITTGNLAPFVPAPSVSFANRVAAEGDTLVIGAASTSGGGPVYILEHDGNRWQAAAELDSLPPGNLPPEPEITIENGYVFVGSQLEEAQGGKVYVYKRTTAGWSVHQVLRGTPHLTFQRFGQSLDIQDGALVLGAPGESQGAPFAGAAFIFRPTGEVWQQVAIARAAQPVSLIRMGTPLRMDRGLVAVAAQAGNLFSQGGQVHVFDVVAQMGTAYGQVETNSTGGRATLSAFGGAVIDHNCLTFQANGLPPNQFGYFLMSLSQGFVPLFGGSEGNLHLALPIVRFSSDILTSDINGSAVFEPDLSALPQGTMFQPGETWNFQIWFRDTNPGLTSNTSNGLAVTFETTGDPAVQFPSTLHELEELTTQFNVAITLSQAADEDIVIPYTTGGTATYNVDWRVEEPNPIIIPAGETSYEMTIIVAEDTDQEGDETGVVTLGTPTGGVLGTAPEFTLTIVDDD